MLLRGIRAHLLSSCATLLLAVVVSAGAVGVAGAARVGHTPAGVAGMLALYGAVALAGQTARATAARGHDVALARLRGMTGARLVTFAAAPLLAICLVGIATGSAVGVLMARRIAGHWHTAYSLGSAEILLALALLLGAWLTVVLVAAGSLRRPLVDALSVLPRPGDRLVARFLEILVVLAAALAVYEAHAGSRSWVPVVAPALVALAAGQVVTWLVALPPRLGRGLGLALTVSRLRCDPDPGSVLRIMVAAAVLLAVTLTGGRAASVWRDDAARLRAGGPIAVPFAAGGLRAYAASHDADPEGRWLMAEVGVDDLRPGFRRVFVDAKRWPAVVGDFFAGTGAADASRHLPAMAAQIDPVMLRGQSVKARVSGLGPGDAVVLTVDYTSDAGYPHRSRIRVLQDGSASGRLSRCRVGCSLLTVTARGSTVALVERLSVGSTQLLSHPAAYPGGGRPARLDDASAAHTAQQALVTPGIAVHKTVPGIDGTSPDVSVVGGIDALPLLGRYGSLMDLSRVLRGAVGTVAAGRSFVVARADTPASVLATLHADGGGDPTSYTGALSSLAGTRQARGDTLAFLVSLGVALVALTHLGAWLVGQLARRRAEVAGLRVAGFAPRAVRRAYRVEAMVLALVVVVGSLVPSVVTMSTLLRPMRLVGGWPEAPPVDLSLRLWVLLASVVGTAVVVAIACLFVFTRFGRSARPSALRSADR